jgi:hypothetical protein
MSNRYKGGVISATPPTTTGGESGTASGAWTLEQQMQLMAAGLWPLQPTPKYIEDVFSTYLYIGNGSTAPETQTINNGINLSGDGGLVWIKNRSAATSNALFDTVRGATKQLVSSSTTAQTTDASTLTSFNNNGFSVYYGQGVNGQNNEIVSWAFKKQSKFFDIVTYTGNGSNPRTISHNLGSTPGCIIFKSFSDSGYGWVTWHRSLNANGALQVQTDGAEIIDANLWGGSPTSTTFSVSSYSGQNVNGIQYVAYVFAHDAGGFGALGTDNVISCGSFTTPSSGDGTITLGYEPQWLLVKSSSNSSDWYMVDTMRGLSQGLQLRLNANLSVSEEATSEPWFKVTPTGFTASPASIGGSRTFIYIAIRRGPMRTPTVGTSVFSMATAVGTAPSFVANSVVDMGFNTTINVGTLFFAQTRLQGPFYSNVRTTAAEVSEASRTWDYMNGMIDSQSLNSNHLGWMFRRAPNFFDVVCYLGTGATTNFSHNLGVVPEMMITKRRSNTGPWVVYTATTGNTDYLQLYTNDAVQTNTGYYNSTTPTSSVFTLGLSTSTNATAQTFVAYLFATCPGVSKVGSYTGTDALQTINCGFTTGARFVLIKRTDAAGDWYLYDTFRGMSSGADPYILVNSTAAQTTGTNYVDTSATGFQVTASAPSALNSSGGTFIFLAIA